MNGRVGHRGAGCVGEEASMTFGGPFQVVHGIMLGTVGTSLRSYYSHAPSEGRYSFLVRLIFF